MFNYTNNSISFVKKKSKLLNNISKQNNRNSFLLDNLISDLYLFLLNVVPKNIALAASVNSRDAFEYFLDYSIQDMKLILKNSNETWTLFYKVYPSYINTMDKIKKFNSVSDADVTVINLKDFYEKNIKKYYN